MWERARAAGLRVVLLGGTATAIGLVVWVALSRSGEQADARAAGRPARAAVPEEPDSADGTREPAAALPATRFVRRLEVGADLRRLFDDVEEKGVGAAGFHDRYAQIRPHLLEADGKPKDGERPSRTLLRLTEPRRDLGSLVLAGAPAGDPLGASMRVRIWTRKEAHPEEGRARVAATFDHIVKHVGRDMREGVDLLVTPGMGRDVFPHQPSPWLAIGLYFRKDRYCAVRAQLPPDLVAEVAEHEIVHAYHLSMKSPTESRFISEGLAEYLRLVEPGDRGLDVPRERLADSCAELLAIVSRLKAAGVGLDKVDPRRLVELPPREFYSLHHLGYLVAQLAMAYVGGATVQRGLEGDSDAALVDAVRRIGWGDFLRFVEEGARGGVVGRVRVVEDGPDNEWDRSAFASALKAAGATLPDHAVNPSLARAEASAALDANLEGFVMAVGEGTWTPRICVDLSEAMDRPIQLAAIPKPMAELLRSMPRGDTPRGFAKELIARLAEQRPVEVLGLAKERRSGGVGVLGTVEPLHLAVVGHGATPAVDILVIGSAEVAREAVAVAPGLGTILLVVDLTPDAGALEIARAADNLRLSAYWRPIRD